MIVKLILDEKDIKQAVAYYLTNYCKHNNISVISLEIAKDEYSELLEVQATTSYYMP